MFVTAASWKSAAQVVKAESGPLRLKVNPDSAEYRCSIDRIEGDPAPLKIEGCIKLFARPRLNAAEQLGLFAGAAAVLTPKIQFKAINQFDFLKQGGILTQRPLLQRSLKNFVVTWDFLIFIR
jgi:hypothetical protein